MKSLITALILLVSSVCFAETFQEYLNNQQAQSKFAAAKKVTKAVETITTNVLDCGVTIETGSLKQYSELNKLCSDVVIKYRTSFPDYIIPAKVKVPVSFLSSQILVQYFGRRVDGAKGLVKLDGFTDISPIGKPIHFYVLSNWPSVFYFKTVFAHELFHVLNALSHHEDSEKGAEAFTKSIGLGV